MTTAEERVAYIEGQMSEQSQMLTEVRDAVRHLERRMDSRFEGQDGRFAGLDRRFDMVELRFDAVDRRFESMDRRFESMDRRFDTVDQRFDRVDIRIDGLDGKMSRHFMWLVGMQVTTLVAIAGALIAKG